MSVGIIVKVDKQGRVVLPEDVRKTLGIEGETEMVCRVVGNRIILERFSVEAISKAFAELEEIAPSLDTEEVEEKDKYVDREYALRKIGIRSNS
ncbi:AbrB/MazE/SpoVT family DNA-binding domain-containing protein [Candidatus Methanodesulfokora washburnensis]|uniref:AbrB/MazE/SpoVT family DNA-binding domain-containing protein n=1 Tax=Candidatus Methanodesulfokora washburnensis TaxID=2478471 RepID=UPI0013872007|nr:AbrB/MazE/SpoVT family DNA-binding domain-containing protein [Candidatus Methanodesulfokores washburnensis]